MEKLTPEILVGLNRLARWRVSLPDSRAQQFRSAAQRLRTCLIAASIEYIATRIHSQKSGGAAFFTMPGATFGQRKFSRLGWVLRASHCATIGNVHLRFFRRSAVVGRM
jgi:hypothetical protein